MTARRKRPFFNVILPTTICLAMSCSQTATPPPMEVAKRSESTGSSTAVYDPDPNHLWNRLYAAFYLREVEDMDSVPVTLGPNVVDPPLGLHSRFLLDGAGFITCRDILEEFHKKRGHELISDPLKRAVLQRDLWAVFDVLQGVIPSNFFLNGGERLPKLTAEQEERRAALSLQIAQAIKAVALPRSELDRLPNTYILAVKSGAFSSRPIDQRSADYLPSDLEEADSPWLEIFPPESGPRTKEGFLHTEIVRGRSVFRVFAKGPASPEGTGQFKQWLEQMTKSLEARLGAKSGFDLNGEEHRQWERTMKMLPVGSQFVLLRRMTCLDPDMNLVPTRVVESIQIRIDGPHDNFNADHIFEEFAFDRRLLFAGRQGGLQPVREGERHPAAYYALGHLVSDEEGQVVPLGEFPRVCFICHGTPVQSFSFMLSQGGQQDPEKVGKRTLRWKMEQDDYRRLRDLASTQPR
ncbi:MAG TPA: hypothetical protein VE981_01020 [Planctomycetota bacterium]|nr:hypothetical protein [Planctomycetota bacterium]